MEKLADIGVFGGSGFYSFLEDLKEVKVETLMECLLTVYLSAKLVIIALHLCHATEETIQFYLI